MKGKFYRVRRHTEREREKANMKDKQVEQLWREFEDITTYEDKNGALYIVSAWNNFEAGTNITDIQGWFNNNHSKGIYYLVNELE
jgi:predicted nucleic acid-binding protein